MTNYTRQSAEQEQEVRVAIAAVTFSSARFFFIVVNDLCNKRL